MPEPRRESVDVTALLRNILDNYPAGSATIREFLQNTDDSGASTQTFYLDTRTFSSDALVDTSLTSCQGPAIIAVNNEYFLDKDWKAITSIHNSSKKSDETSTGKYGLGFRSSYHVTDNPQILSGDGLLILDAHQRVARFPGGFKLSTDGDDRQDYPGHFDTFSAVLSPADKRYEGTAIRLPLRLDASQSTIKSTPTDIAAARQMFQDFMIKDLAECMLFLKNITNVSLIEIAQDGTQTILGRSWIDNPDVVGPLRSRDRGREAETSHHRLTVHVEVGKNVSVSQWIITQFVEEYQVAQSHLEKRLGRSSLADDMKAEKLLPHVALAFPVNERDPVAPDFAGRLFTLLPLPIFTGFPLHINAVLALTSSRQNLRSAADAVKGSREEFLVEWNKVVFAEFVPKAWAAMFKYIAALPREIDLFAAWPPFPISAEGDRMYWHPLPTRLLEEAGPMAVWPVQLVSIQSAPAYHTLSEVLVGSPSSTDPISSLQACGAPIITPPTSVHSLIQQAAHYRSRLVTPAAVYPFLKKNASSFSGLDAAAVKAIADYLATAGEVTFLYDLPIFLNCKGRYTSLLSRMVHTFATDSEADLFQGADPDLLKLDNVSPVTRTVLLKAPAEKIHLVRATDVAQYLSRLFSRFRSQAATITLGVKAEDTAWLVRFWNWVNTWSQASSLFSQTVSAVLQQLYLIPMDAPADQPKLRKLARGAMDGRSLDSDIRGVFRVLEVPILHPDVSIGPQTQNLMTKQPVITFILENIAAHTSFDHLDQTSRHILHSFVADQLSPFHRSGQRLSSAHHTALRNLPIFPALSSGPRTKSLGSAQTYGVASKSSSFVDDSVQVVPSISGKSFLDGRACDILAQALAQGMEGEMDVLKLVLEPTNWAQQEYVEDLPDLLIDRLVRRLNDFDHDGRRRIADLPIVVVGEKRARVKPSLVVDPKSKIACLYDVEDGVLPHGRFADDGPGTLLQQFRSFGMLRSVLADFTIVELITKLGDHSTPFSPREKKALLLLPLLDEYAASTSISSGLQTTLRNQMWLPANGKMNRPSECWDSRRSDAELCDFVLPLVPRVVYNPSLREAMGWASVSSDVLQAQFVAVVRERPMYPFSHQSHPSKRIIPILRELSRRFQARTISTDVLSEVVDSLGDYPWVPVALDSCRQPQQTMLSRIELGTRFHRVYSLLTEQAGLVDMLKVMGIYDRPSPSALLTELQSIAADLIQASVDGQPKTDILRDAVAILHEISQRSEEFDMAQVLVLDEKEEMKPITTVIYNDRGYDTGLPPPGSFFAHSTISRSVALALGLRQLSEEEFDRAEDDVETFHMVEELSTRVKNTLKGYDMEYASNEWVANADDANASTIKFILHEGTFPGTKLLGPDLKQFQEVPSLVIYNDGVFSEKDFKGIGSVGLGGKGDTPGKIGRFGLGAFSFYHFTDLLMVVSAGYVLFLDPSQSYLPRKNGQRQTGVKMPLSTCRLRYPDQLKPFDGMFGFNSSTETYQGTLFRLPLRTASQAAQSKLSSKGFTVFDLSNILHRYFRASTQSMFFSKMKSISAMRQPPSGTMSTLWSVEGSRRSRGREEDGMRVELDIRDSDKARWKERWLVCMSSHQEADFPADLQVLFRQHRLPPPIIGIALNTSSEGNPSRDLNFRLFATLPLPVSTSLPTHVHATWILSDDRRSLRYDLPDGSGHRPLDAKYNEYILQTLIPPLYLRALAIISSRNPHETNRCWPTQPTDPISQAVSSALYARLKDSEERVLRTTLDELVAPKDALIHVYGPVAVGKLLAALGPQDFVRYLPFNPTLVEEWDGLRTDNASDIADLLRDSSQLVRKFYATDTAKAAEIDTVLRYLLKAEVAMTGVPLLQLGDGQVTSFKPASEGTVFCSNRFEVGSIFGKDKIIGPDISEKMVESLVSLDLNVRKLDTEGLRELLQRCKAQVVTRDEADIAVESRPWYQQLIAFLTGSTSPVKFEEVSDLPLIPVSHGAVAISLSRAQRPGVWWQSYGDEDITPVLRQCNIPIVDFTNSVSYRKHAVDLPGVLDVFGSSGIHHQLAQHRVVSTPEWPVFADWIKRRLDSTQVQRLAEPQLQTLGYLPLFAGQQGQTSLPFVSASNTSMLPAQITASDVARYLPSHTIFSSFSYPLQAALERLGSDRRLSIHAVIDKLNLPSVLPPNEEAGLKSVINIIWQHRRGIYSSPLVPDENWNLRVPSTLYDGNVAVFRQSFSNRSEGFVHPNFNDIVYKLVPLGVHQDVTTGDIVSCARAVDQDSRRGGIDTRTRAEFLWHFINEDFNDARRLDFNAISDLRFVPSHPLRHPSDPQFSHYGRVLPDVLSLGELCSAEHAQTVWTQRATFAEAPSVITRAISQQLGVPTIQELVDHLVVLTTIVAIEHPGNRLVLSDIRHTYTAIHQQAEAAKPILLRHKDRRIWLNVDDPATGDWAWRSAAELVFDLRYDNDRFYDVKTFLEPYREMLIGAGANGYRYATLELAAQPETAQSSHADKLLAGYQGLRKRGALFDIQFIVKGESIKAHRSLLAAVIPHFGLAFTTGFRESQSLSSMMDLDDEVPVYAMSVETSPFAVQSVIDFVYTGKFTHPSSETTAESGLALEALLELLELANFWQLEELKIQAIKALVELQLVRAETCDDILERAQRFNAPELVKVCQQNKANNQWI